MKKININRHKFIKVYKMSEVLGLCNFMGIFLSNSLKYLLYYQLPNKIKPKHVSMNPNPIISLASIYVPAFSVHTTHCMPQSYICSCLVIGFFPLYPLTLYFHSSGISFKGVSLPGRSSLTLNPAQFSWPLDIN